MAPYWGLIIGAMVIGGLLVVVSRYYLSLWLQAYVTGARISLVALILMSLRKVSPKVIVQCKVMAAQAGLPNITTASLESQYLAGGDVERVTLALIAAQRARIDLDWNTASAIDLAGRDVLEAVQVSVTPRVINCPDSGSEHRDTLDGVAKDGVQLKVHVLVTVRTNLSQLIGGATETTVIARVGEGIVSAIGSCENYRKALADPLVITRQVLEKGLDSQTAYAIVSIDIADIDVGANIGARLRLDQAEADIRIARATAEQRRAMAAAREQEMIALTRENEAAVVLAEAQIPHAIAQAFRAGQLRTQHSPSQTNRRTSLRRNTPNASRIVRTAARAASSQYSGGVQDWETEGGSAV